MKKFWLFLYWWVWRKMPFQNVWACNRCGYFDESWAFAHAHLETYKCKGKACPHCGCANVEVI